jgi:5-hydroxyisourate hydrolase
MAGKMSGISTHVLDLTWGKPAVGLAVRLEGAQGEAWSPLSSQITDGSGRCDGLIARDRLQLGVYRLIFETGDYFRRQDVVSMYPEISISFRVQEEKESYHIPLLLAPNGFTTYRGS